MLFGERLRNRRIEKKMTQDELAKKLGMGRSNVGHMENGRTIPTADVLQKIADVLDVTIDFLLGRVENKYPNKYKDMPQNEPGIQIIMRAKDELSPKAYEKLIQLTEKMKLMFEADEEDDN